ncbi:MAG: hypothetical protein HQK53_13775 [Oligoflexia bacterium]|nr:hypothetical protein [Oligoflexia bacterium]
MKSYEKIILVILVILKNSIQPLLLFRVKTIVTALFLLLLNSCSFIIKNVEREEDPFYRLKDNQQRTTFCDNYHPESAKQPIKQRTIISGEYSNAQDHFYKFLQRSNEKKFNLKFNLTFIEKFVLLSFLQFNLRPEVSSPTANLLLFIEHQGKSKYWNFTANPHLLKAMAIHSKLTDLIALKEKAMPIKPGSIIEQQQQQKKKQQEQQKLQKIQKQQKQQKKQKEVLTKKNTAGTLYPSLFALETLLQAYPSNHSLLELATLFDQHFNYTFKVEEKFGTFLATNENLLKGTEISKNSYFRDDEILKKGEVLPRINIRKIILHYLKYVSKEHKDAAYVADNQVFAYHNGPITDNTQIKIDCNLDLKLYHDYQYKVLTQKANSNQYALQIDDSALWASSFQLPGAAQIIDGEIIIAGSVPLELRNHAAVCMINTPAMHLSILAAEDRDPGLHLFHFLKNNFVPLLSTKTSPYFLSLQETVQLYDLPRYLILQDPLRIIIETTRMTADQQRECYLMDYAIYHANRLASFLGYLRLTNLNFSGIIIDKRSEQHLNGDCTHALPIN